MRYHAKKSIAMIITTILITGVVGYLMATNYPSDGLFLKDVAPYFSKYIIILLIAYAVSRLLMSGLFQLLHYKQKEEKPWLKTDQDKLVEYSSIVNIFLIGAIGLLIGFALMVFNQPLTLLFIVLFGVVFACELTYWLSVFIYHRKASEENE